MNTDRLKETKNNKCNYNHEHGFIFYMDNNSRVRYSPHGLIQPTQIDKTGTDPIRSTQIARIVLNAKRKRRQ